MCSKLEIELNRLEANEGLGGGDILADGLNKYILQIIIQYVRMSDVDIPLSWCYM